MGLPSAPWTCPLCREACVLFFWFRGPTVCAAWFVCTAEVCMHASLGTLDPPSALLGFCGLLSVPQARRLVRATVCELFMGWEVQLSLFSALWAPALPSWDSAAPPWVSFVRELPSARELFLLHDSFSPSGHKLPYRSSQSFLFICPHPLSYLISGSLAILPGGLASSAVSLKLLCRSSSISWQVFDVLVGRLQSSRLTSLTNLVGSSSDATSFGLFILFMAFLHQEYWNGLPLPPWVYHVLSDLFTWTHLSWVALHGMAHSFVELHKPLCLDKAVVYEVD